VSGEYGVFSGFCFSLKRKAEARNVVAMRSQHPEKSEAYRGLNILSGLIVDATEDCYCDISDILKNFLHKKQFVC
jgi:hypothetical protein